MSSEWEFQQLDNDTRFYDNELRGMWADRYRGRPDRIDKLKRREINNE